MIDTPITTAARRIARDVNRTDRGLVAYYDVDGTYLGGHPAEQHYANPATDAPAGIAVKVRGHRGRDAWGSEMHLTYRDAQDLLDAHAATGRYDGADHATWLADLHSTRESVHV